MRVFAHHQVRKQTHFLTHRRQLEERRHGRLQLVSEPADVDRELRGRLGGDRATQRADHRPACLRRAPPCCASVPSRRACAWHTATASASAASAPGRSASPSSVRIICATWNFSAAPEPTTASLMARGAYSNTGTASGMAHSAAPRACPSFKALSALRLTNTRSTATSAGWCWDISARRPSKIMRRRAAGAAAARLRQPCATAMSSPPRHSITPKPVRREPGSSPSTRTVSAALNCAAAGPNARQDLVRYLDIRVHVPYFVQLFERFQQLHHQHRGLARQLQGGRGALRDFRGRGREAVMLEYGAHGIELQGIGQYLDGTVSVGYDVFGAGFQRHLHQPLLVRPRRVGHEAHGVEQVAHRAVGPESAPVLHECAAHLRAHQAAIVGDALDHDRSATGAVTFVAHGLPAFRRGACEALVTPQYPGAPAAPDVSPLAVPRHR